MGSTPTGAGSGGEGVPHHPLYPGRVSKRSDPATGTDAADTDRPATPIRVAGALTTLEGVLALIVAAVLVIRGLTEDRHDAFNGIGTALWLAIIFGGVLAGGVALVTGRRWGRAISVVAQILLLPVSYYLFTSHQPLWAVPLGLLALITLGFLFAPASLRWIAGDLEISEPEPPARSGRPKGSPPGSKRRGTR